LWADALIPAADPSSSVEPTSKFIKDERTAPSPGSSVEPSIRRHILAVERAPAIARAGPMDLQALFVGRC